MVVSKEKSEDIPIHVHIIKRGPPSNQVYQDTHMIGPTIGEHTTRVSKAHNDRKVYTST